MIQSIKNLLSTYGVDGDLILYRDGRHRKEGLAKYLSLNLNLGDKDVCTWSDGAFSLYLARALPDRTVHACFDIISPDYGELMEAQPNLVLHPKIHRKSVTENGYAYFVTKHPDLVSINQYSDPIVKQYYSTYFFNVVSALSDYSIDAFCDCSHSGATLAGFIESGLVDWEFVVGHLDVNDAIYDGYVTSIQSFLRNPMLKITSESCNYFDTYELGLAIEREYPDFGNVYEATRSISAAMRWLQKNPGKTIAVYVGDSFEKEGSKFNSSSKSYIGAKELYFLTDAMVQLKVSGCIDKGLLASYAGLWDSDDEHKKYVLSKLLSYVCKFVESHGALNSAKAYKLLNGVKSVVPSISDSTIALLDLFWKSDIDTLRARLWDAIGSEGCDPVVAYEALTYLKTLVDFTSDMDQFFISCERDTKEIYAYFKSLGPVR